MGELLKYDIKNYSSIRQIIRLFMQHTKLQTRWMESVLRGEDACASSLASKIASVKEEENKIISSLPKGDLKDKLCEWRSTLLLGEKAVSEGIGVPYFASPKYYMLLKNLEQIDNSKLIQTYLHTIKRFDAASSFEVKHALYDVIFVIEDYLEFGIGDAALPILKRLTKVDASTTSEALDLLSGYVHIVMLKDMCLELLKLVKKNISKQEGEEEPPEGIEKAYS